MKIVCLLVLICMLGLVQAFEFNETFELRTCDEKDVVDFWGLYTWSSDLRHWCRFDCNPDCSMAVVDKDNRFWFPKFEFKGLASMKGICNPKHVSIHFGIFPDRSSKYVPVCRLFSDELTPAYTLEFEKYGGIYIMEEKCPIEVALRDAVMISDIVFFNDILGMVTE